MPIKHRTAPGWPYGMCRMPTGRQKQNNQAESEQQQHQERRCLQQKSPVFHSFRVDAPSIRGHKMSVQRPPPSAAHCWRGLLVGEDVLCHLRALRLITFRFEVLIPVARAPRGGWASGLAGWASQPTVCESLLFTFHLSLHCFSSRFDPIGWWWLVVALPVPVKVRDENISIFSNYSSSAALCSVASVLFVVQRETGRGRLDKKWTPQSKHFDNVGHSGSSSGSTGTMMVA